MTDSISRAAPWQGNAGSEGRGKGRRPLGLRRREDPALRLVDRPDLPDVRAARLVRKMHEVEPIRRLDGAPHDERVITQVAQPLERADVI